MKPEWPKNEDWTEVDSDQIIVCRPRDGRRSQYEERNHTIEESTDD